MARQHEEPSLALRLYEHGLSLKPSAFHYDQLGVMLRSASRQDEAVKPCANRRVVAKPANLK